MSKVDDALTEVEAELAIFGPKFEGLMDDERVNILAPTRQEVIGVRARVERRISLLIHLQEASKALIADGHPQFEIEDADDSVLADLDNQIATMQAARTLFQSNRATAVTLTAGEPEQK